MGARQPGAACRRDAATNTIAATNATSALLIRRYLSTEIQGGAPRRRAALADERRGAEAPARTQQAKSASFIQKKPLRQ